MPKLPTDMTPAGVAKRAAVSAKIKAATPPPATTTQAPKPRIAKKR